MKLQLLPLLASAALLLAGVTGASAGTLANVKAKGYLDSRMRGKDIKESAGRRQLGNEV